MQDAMTSQTGLWSYLVEEDHISEDGYKYEHYAVNDKTGQRINLDFTPYHVMPRNAFAKLVEMDFPPRPDMSPWTAGGVKEAYAAYQRRNKLIPLFEGVQTVAAAVVFIAIAAQVAPFLTDLSASAFDLVEMATYIRLH